MDLSLNGNYLSVNKASVSSARINDINSSLKSAVQSQKASNPMLDDLSRLIDDAQSDNSSTKPSTLAALVKIDGQLSDIEKEVNELNISASMTMDEKKLALEKIAKLQSQLDEIQKKLDQIGQESQVDDKARKIQENLLFQSAILNKQAEANRESTKAEVKAV